MNNLYTLNWQEMVQNVHFKWAVPCGWWTDLQTGGKLQRDWSEACLLVVSEVIEAMEGLRKGLMDDKIPSRPMVEVELADAIIRLCDMAGGFGFEVCLEGQSPIQFPQNTTKAGKLMFIVKNINSLHSCNEQDLYANSRTLSRSVKSTTVLSSIFSFCNEYDYDLIGAIKEKHEYNKIREDHKLENRKKANGKQF